MPWLSEAWANSFLRSRSSKSVLFWSKSNQAAHITCWGQRISRVLRTVLGGWMGRMGTSQSSVLPLRRWALGPQVTAEQRQLMSFLTSELYQPEKGRHKRLLGGSLRTCQPQHGDSNGKARPPPIVRPPGTTEALRWGVGRVERGSSWDPGSVSFKILGCERWQARGNTEAGPSAEFFLSRLRLCPLSSC